MHLWIRKKSDAEDMKKKIAERERLLFRMERKQFLESFAPKRTSSTEYFAKERLSKSNDLNWIVCNCCVSNNFGPRWNLSEEVVPKISFIHHDQRPERNLKIFIRMNNEYFHQPQIEIKQWLQFITKRRSSLNLFHGIIDQYQRNKDFNGTHLDFVGGFDQFWMRKFGG